MLHGRYAADLPDDRLRGLITFGVVHAAIYRSVAHAWPPRIVPRALRMAFVLFALSFAFWEFFTPFNQLGEPFRLIALELSFWAVIALAEAFTLAALLELREDSRHIPLSGRPLIRQHSTETDNASDERELTLPGFARWDPGSARERVR
jgi:hypothetical protein